MGQHWLWDQLHPPMDRHQTQDHLSLALLSSRPTHKLWDFQGPAARDPEMQLHLPMSLH